MLLIAGTLRVQADARDAVVAALIDMNAESAKEDGCISYDFSADLVDPTLFHLFEEWESQAHLDAHGASVHMGIFQQTLVNLGSMERSIFIYDGDNKKPL